MTMKQFRMQEAERCGVSDTSTIHRRIALGWYGDSIKITHKNKRVVTVEVLKPLPVIPPQKGVKFIPSK